VILTLTHALVHKHTLRHRYSHADIVAALDSARGDGAGAAQRVSPHTLSSPTRPLGGESNLATVPSLTLLFGLSIRFVLYGVCGDGVVDVITEVCVLCVCVCVCVLCVCV
jgi:hypothetical protein